MKNIVILLTGCICPNTTEGLVVNNADTRKQQYLDAIHWYLNNTPYHIVGKFSIEVQKFEGFQAL